MSDNFAYDVFLSHNQADKPRVRRLAERLRAAGMRVWFDEWIIQAGDIIALKVDEGLEQSRVLLLCVSPTALASGWVGLERSTAIHRDPSNEGRRFIPLLLADCNLPDTLRRYKYVDFRQEADAAFSELLTACRCEANEVLGLPGGNSRKEAAVVESLVPKRPKTTHPHASSPLASSGRQSDSQDRAAIVFERTLSFRVAGCAFDPSGIWLAQGGPNGIDVFSTSTFERVASLRHESGKLVETTFMPSGRLLGLSEDSRLDVWDVASETITSKVELKTTICKIRGALTRSGEAVLGISNVAHELKLLDVRTGRVVATLAGHKDRVWDLAVTPDGRYAVSGSDDGQIKVWDVQNAKCIGTLFQQEGPARRVAISADGRHVVSGGGGDIMARPVKIWDIDQLICVGTLEGPSGVMTSLALSRDGEWVAAACYNFDASLWHRESGICVVKEFDELGNGIPGAVEFAPDSKHIFVEPSMGSETNVYRLTGRVSLTAAQETRRYVNAKVVLLGEGTVGKTSLAHRLIEDQFVVRDRTHGMNVWRLELPLSSDNTVEREALLWDLAGQEDYRLIHQLFLEQTALALLLINPQKDDPFAEVGDWLKALKSACGHSDSARNATWLLIFSQTDVGGMKLSNMKIDRFREQHGFADWLPTSAKTGANCSDKEAGGQPSKLKQLIATNIPWDKLPWTSTPRLLAELKNAVMAMRDESDIRLLRFSELAQRLEQTLADETFGEADVRTAVTLLANHGLARPLKFGDLVLLRPDLINGYAGAVIRAARAHTDEIGCVLEADIYRPDFDFTGVERLKHRPDEELLLRALVQTFLDHSLCIAEDTPHGRHLVFPSQYRREKDIPHEPDIFVSYTFSGEWQTVWTTLVVRLWCSQEFAHRELWRNAAEFESARKQTLGLKITKTGDGAATISLYFDPKVPDELKVIFIEYVHRHLAKYACDVTRDRRYVCPACGTAVKDLDAVRRRLEAKKDFITCQECDEKVPFIDFIEQRLKSDSVARKILAMVETATCELDTQALEQILMGHMMAIAGEANQIFRPVSMLDHGIDGEVEFKDNDGKASGKRIYIQLKSGNSYLCTRKADDSEVFNVKDERHLEYWISQPVDVYLVIRQMDRLNGQQVIRWMNVTRYLKARKDKESRQIVFHGEKLDMEAVWKVRDEFFR